MRDACRNEQRIAGLEYHRRPPFELILERAADDIGDFHAGMRMPRRGDASVEIDTRLNHFAIVSAEILTNQIGAAQTFLSARCRCIRRMGEAGQGGEDNGRSHKQWTVHGDALLSVVLV